ncbi:hypothetical protein EJ04DRAFT_594754 [Polyplosphaeria fusca]|uniref:Uncharacterized protein n=1 Tax=Polyplosphaeria fusca TaxID=682080 RepID=A0A9P4QMF6_9PLEO|nr:hypothetical protein EJ04DRAFT_594754 [Polyplosphaeria fusca]
MPDPLLPLQIFELRPTSLQTRSWGSRLTTTTSPRILSVIPTHPHPSKTPKYHIDTAHTSSFPLWPWNSAQIIACHSSSADPETIHARRATPLATLSQTHSAFAHLMCSVGSVRPAPDSALEAGKEDAGDVLPTVPAHVALSSGLGHGEWRDAVLEPHFTPNGKGVVEKSVDWGEYRVKWGAGGPRDRKAVRGWGESDGGWVEVRDKGDVLAIYKPRGAAWVGKEEEEREESARGLGVLVVCDERVGGSEEVVRHVLMVAVGLEEQILRSKGFEPRNYHAGWD